MGKVDDVLESGYDLYKLGRGLVERMRAEDALSQGELSELARLHARYARHVAALPEKTQQALWDTAQKVRELQVTQNSLAKERAKPGRRQNARKIARLSARLGELRDREFRRGLAEFHHVQDVITLRDMNVLRDEVQTVHWVLRQQLQRAGVAEMAVKTGAFLVHVALYAVSKLA